jgi:hypothetical protein
MKKADAKYILESIEWMNENTTVEIVDVETYGNLFMNSQNLLMDEVNGVKKSDEPALNLPVVVGQREQFNKFYAWLDGLTQVEYDDMSLTSKCEKFFFKT